MVPSFQLHSGSGLTRYILIYSHFSGTVISVVNIGNVINTTGPRLFKRWIALSTGSITILRISRESNCTIHWIMIYPVDSAIQPLNNRGLFYKSIMLWIETVWSLSVRLGSNFVIRRRNRYTLLLTVVFGFLFVSDYIIRLSTRLLT